MPEALVKAMSALAWSWGWKRWACITLLCFYSITRIGEVLGATRKELLTARDAMEQSGRLYLLIRCPKTRHRGARVQHAEAVGPGWIIDFLSEFFQDLPRTQALYGGSPRVYRRRWDKVLLALGIPSHLRLTPGSLRGGGAVWAHKNGTAISDLQWRMRLGHQTTLAYYLPGDYGCFHPPLAHQGQPRKCSGSRGPLEVFLHSPNQRIAMPSRLFIADGR